ncbi:hypothetical protein DFH06DRAFT_1141841 [Mycena polygramma]|nr:hypothetical protein DFH06DRAFT_1141841 [Mycena polygramma]
MYALGLIPKGPNSAHWDMVVRLRIPDLRTKRQWLQRAEEFISQVSLRMGVRKAGYSYPSRWVEEPGYWLYEGVFGGPSSDKDRRNTTLEGAEGERDFGKKVERGAGWEKTLVVAKPKSRGNPYFLHIGGVVDLQGDRGSWKGFLSPCMPFEICSLEEFRDSRITRS